MTQNYWHVKNDTLWSSRMRLRGTCDKPRRSAVYAFNHLAYLRCESSCRSSYSRLFLIPTDTPWMRDLMNEWLSVLQAGGRSGSPLSSLFLSAAFSRPLSRPSFDLLPLSVSSKNISPIKCVAIVSVWLWLAASNSGTYSLLSCWHANMNVNFSQTVTTATIFTESLISLFPSSTSSYVYCCASCDGDSDTDRAQIITDPMSSTATTTTQQVERRERKSGGAPCFKSLWLWWTDSYQFCDPRFW